MQVITLELINEDALSLLKDLERLNILRLIKTQTKTTPQPKRRWAGSISKETAAKMLNEVEKSRNSWERNI